MLPALKSTVPIGSSSLWRRDTAWYASSSQKFFFFSSRRRHTRFSRDWSSDVCSSDLPGGRQVVGGQDADLLPLLFPAVEVGQRHDEVTFGCHPEIPWDR